MTDRSTTRPAHWQRVYETKATDSVSWFRPHLDTSLELMERAGLSSRSRVIDIGGGASTLVEDLLDRGVKNITVLDIASKPLAIARARLGSRAQDANWLVGDVLRAELPTGGFDIWHDRALLHFLDDPADLAAYSKQAARAVTAGGYAVIGGFAPGGPEQCSGLPVARRSAEAIAQVLAPSFSLLDTRSERHHTPAGNEQSFAYALLKRI